MALVDGDGIAWSNGKDRQDAGQPGEARLPLGQQHDPNLGRVRLNVAQNNPELENRQNFISQRFIIDFSNDIITFN